MDETDSRETAQPLQILIIEDSKSDAALLTRHIRQEISDFSYEQIETAADLRAALDKKSWDVILSDYHLPSFSVMEALKILKERKLDLPFIIVSGAVKDVDAVAALKAGAHDFVSKDNLTRLVLAMQRELREVESRAARKTAEKALEETARKETMSRQIIQSVHSSLDLDEIFEHIAITLGKFLETDRCFISRYDEENHVLSPPTKEYLSSKNIESMITADSALWQAFCSFARELCQHKETLDFSKNIGLSPELQEWLGHIKVKSGLGCPIIYRGNCLAVLFVHQVQNQRIWTETEVKIIETVALQAGVAIHQAELYHTAQQAREEAEAATRKKSAFLALMSHELRTPLNSILGYTRMMERGMAGPITEKQEQYLHNVSFSGQHLLGIINDLLDISKIEAGKMTIKPEVFKIQPVIDELIAILQELARKNEIHLVFEIAPELQSIQADPGRFKQILINLINNAIKFNRPNGQVCVRLNKSQDGEWLVGQVKDTGIGIPEAQLEGLFQRFYQVDTTASRKHEGTGLGLALTRELVELHGGSITIESTENVGTTFTFKLPILLVPNS